MRDYVVCVRGDVYELQYDPPFGFDSRLVVPDPVIDVVGLGAGAAPFVMPVCV
jgi:hypothetical protein